MHTGPIRLNLLRQFVAGAEFIYEATASRIGRISAIAAAAAIGPDGKATVIARVTGCRWA